MLFRFEKVLERPIWVAALLSGIALILHYGALVGGWRYDDGPHLKFVASYAPWQYFFIPEVMLEQSWANFTPWNALFYEIGLSFFGLSPAGYYLHLLCVLWLTALATYCLLKQWLPARVAFLAGIIYLGMPATGAIGQMLMTGHYAYGLLFSVLSLYFFSLAVRENSLAKAGVAAVFYLAACYCKELYVPLIGLLVVFPSGGLLARLRLVLPSLMVAAFYTAYRLWVFDGVGGYGVQTHTGTLSASLLYRVFVTNIFGNAYVAVAAILLVLVALGMALWRGVKFSVLVFVACALGAMLFPLAVMLFAGDAGNVGGIRLVYMIAWGVAVALAFAAARSGILQVAMLLLALPLFSAQAIEIQRVVAQDAAVEAQNHFLLTGQADEFLLPFSFRHSSYFEDILTARLLIKGEEGPKVLLDEEMIANLEDAEVEKSYRYSSHCECIRPIDKASHAQRKTQFRYRLSAAEGKRLSVALEVENLGVRRRLRWSFEGPVDGSGEPASEFTLYVRGQTALRLPPSGELVFAATGHFKSMDDITVSVYLESPDGWLARTPQLYLPASGGKVSWAGESAVTLALRDETAQ